MKTGVELNKMMKKLVWRLKEQPTSQSLQELVKSKILTNEEAREILFSSETEENRDKKSLESEIKFLRELVEKLSKRSQIVEVIKEIKTPYRHYPWYNPYTIWCNGTSSEFYLNEESTTLTSGSNNFSDIETF